MIIVHSKIYVLSHLQWVTSSPMLDTVNNFQPSLLAIRRQYPKGELPPPILLWSIEKQKQAASYQGIYGARSNNYLASFVVVVGVGPRRSLLFLRGGAFDDNRHRVARRAGNQQVVVLGSYFSLMLIML
jgi:hypothetical protein